MKAAAPGQERSIRNRKATTGDKGKGKKTQLFPIRTGIEHCLLNAAETTAKPFTRVNKELGGCRLEQIWFLKQYNLYFDLLG